MNRLARPSAGVGKQKELGVTVPLLEGEGLQSLMCRTAVANSFRRPAVLLSFIGLPEVQASFVAFSRPESSDSLAALLGCDTSTFDGLMHPEVSMRRAGVFVSWRGLPLRRTMVEARVRRVAPHAARQLGYHRDEWQIRPLSYCRLSGEVLTSTCPSCMATLGWRRAVEPHCCDVCGTDLVLGRELVSVGDRLNSCRSAGALFDQDPAIRSRAIQALTGALQVYEVSEIVELATDLGEALTPPLKQYLRSDDLGFVDGYEALCTPDLRLAEIAQKLWERRSNDSSSFAQWAGPLTKYVRHSKCNTGLMGFVADRFKKGVADARLPIRSFRKMDTITFRDAARVFGFKTPAVSRLVGRGQCYIGSSGGIHLFDRPLFSEAARLIRGSVGPRKIASAVGISRESVSHLFEIGILKAVNSLDVLLLLGEEFVSSEESLSEFIAKMDRVPISGSDQDGFISVREAVRGVKSSLGCVALLNGILEGSIELRARSNVGSLTDRLFISREVARAALREYQAVHGFKFVTAAQAARMLDTSPNVAGAALRQGLLPGRQIGARMEVDAEDIAHFDDMFIQTKHVAERFGWTSREAATHLRAAGIQPVAKLERSLFWPRQEVERWFIKVELPTP